MNNSANKTYPIIEIVGPVLDDTVIYILNFYNKNLFIFYFYYMTQ